ncbi:MAG: Spy/CpxP family protein refolding chaperone [Thermoanaerobaculia bacterium]
MKKFLAAFLLLAPVLPALAEPETPEGKWWRRPRVAAEIGLTSEQSDQVEKIFVRERGKLIDLRADLEKKQLGLESAMENPAADRADVEKRIGAVEAARAELQKTRALMYLDMKQVLKPEQWSRLVQMRQQRQERIKERRRQFAEQEHDGQERPNQHKDRQPPPPQRER